MGMNRVAQKITPFLWFDDRAEEAAKLYTSIFKNSRLGEISRYDEETANLSGRPKGSVMTVAFEIEGQEFVALNGGPVFKLNESVLVYRELRHAGRGRLFLVETIRRRRRKPLWLAQRQIRFVVASRAHGLERDAQRQRCHASKTRYARDVANGQD